MTDIATHDIFLATLAIGAIVLAVAIGLLRARTRSRRTPMHASAGRPRRSGLTQRIVYTTIGAALMIPDLLVPVFGEFADLVIVVLVSYSWYTYVVPPRPHDGAIARGRHLPPGVDECVRCNGSGFANGTIDPLCGGRGWVPGRNAP